MRSFSEQKKVRSDRASLSQAHSPTCTAPGLAIQKRDAIEKKAVDALVKQRFPRLRSGSAFYFRGQWHQRWSCCWSLDLGQSPGHPHLNTATHGPLRPFSSCSPYPATLMDNPTTTLTFNLCRAPTSSRLSVDQLVRRLYQWRTVSSRQSVMTNLHDRLSLRLHKALDRVTKKAHVIMKVFVLHDYRLQ